MLLSHPHWTTAPESWLGHPEKAPDTLKHVQNLATSPAPSHGRTSPPTLIHHHFVSVKSLITVGLLLVTHNAPSGPILESTDPGLFCILNTSLGTFGEQSFEGGRPHPVELLTIKDQPSISGGLSAWGGLSYLMMLPSWFTLMHHLCIEFWLLFCFLLLL